MVALYIIGGIILLITVFLLLPVVIQIEFENDLFVRLKFLGFTIDELEPEEQEKPESKKPKDEKILKKLRTQEKGTFSKLKAKHGFIGAIKEIFDLLRKFLVAAKPQLLKLKFRKVKLDLIVVGSDAAMTAIDYGTVCGIVYPVLSFIDQNLNVKLKQINVEAGFKHTESVFRLSLDVRMSVILLLIIVYKALEEYKNFSVRNELL